MLTPAEVSRVLDGMEGTHALMARLLYGTGMRLMECLRMFPKLPPPARFPDNAQPEPLLRRVIQPHEQTPGNRTSGRHGRAQAEARRPCLPDLVARRMINEVPGKPSEPLGRD